MDQLKRQADALGALRQQCGILESRLQLVLAPMPPADPENRKEPLEAISLIEILQSHNHSLELAAGWLAQIERRVNL